MGNLKVLVIGNVSGSRIAMLESLGYTIVFASNEGISGESFDKVWIDEFVNACPDIEKLLDIVNPHGELPVFGYLLDDIKIDKPKKVGKNKQQIPFWANNWRRYL